MEKEIKGGEKKEQLVKMLMKYDTNRQRSDLGQIVDPHSCSHFVQHVYKC